jgi:hypothetical protein
VAAGEGRSEWESTGGERRRVEKKPWTIGVGVGIADCRLTIADCRLNMQGVAESLNVQTGGERVAGASCKSMPTGAE